LNILTKTIQGKMVSYTRMGLGLAALGRPGYMTLGHEEDLPAERTREAMMLHAIQVLDAAWAAGIRCYDAARSYGAGEEFLSQWLRIRNISRDNVFVSSKWGYTYTADWKVDAPQHEIKSHDLITLRRQMAETSGYLGHWLRLYQIHSATLDSGVLDNREVLDELARLRDGGLIIGLSLSGARQSDTLEKALLIKRGDESLFGSVQATWNLHERSAGPTLAAAHQNGWLVIVKEGLANGRLTQRGMPSDSSLGELCQSTGFTPDALALAAILQQPWADIVLSGAAAVDHVRSNVQAMAVKWNSAWDDPLQSLGETPEQYWQLRSRLAWN